jgi:hypothetical protein
MRQDNVHVTAALSPFRNAGDCPGVNHRSSRAGDVTLDAILLGHLNGRNRIAPNPVVVSVSITLLQKTRRARTAPIVWLGKGLLGCGMGRLYDDMCV